MYGRVCADLADEDEVMSLGLKDMDIVVTAMGNNLAASIMSVTVAKEQGVPLVVAKASSDRMAAILKKVGADRIIDPEGEGGGRSARILMSSVFKDFYELDENMCLIEMLPKKEWVGKNLEELDLRKKMELNIAPSFGYVTAMPAPETTRSVDAYALGARRADPSAKVMVEYTGSWNDKLGYALQQGFA